ncbi:hypothetical protein M0804_005832 [Polistes exclamans]|nr:hypothetical protein M0804_005832 [Polistes exclamans]
MVVVVVVVVVVLMANGAGGLKRTKYSRNHANLDGSWRANNWQKLENGIEDKGLVPGSRYFCLRGSNAIPWESIKSRRALVLLFPEEGWARSASSSYWTLTPFWWSRSRCKVVEVAGTRRYSTQAKMVDTGTGTLYIIGSFKRMTTDPDFKIHDLRMIESNTPLGYKSSGESFKGDRTIFLSLSRGRLQSDISTIYLCSQLYLTSNVSSSDFNMGYSMTGTLERGCKKTNSFQMTHFAVIRRRDYEKAYEDPNPT